MDNNITDKSKKYSLIKYSLAITDIVYLLVLLFVFQLLGLSAALFEYLASVVSGQFVLPLYLAIVYSVYYLLNLPLNFLSSFFFEHKFNLSKQSIASWAADQVKTYLLSYLLILIIFSAFYYITARFPVSWWIICSFAWMFFSLILAKLMPVLIIPMFFKYKPLSNSSLKRRIIDLADKMGIKLLDVFEIDFSKKTLKANAAFVGSGSTRRVILADTLQDKYTDEEIEVILAHEFAHYKFKHLLKMIIINACITVFIFYLMFKTSGYFLGLFSLDSLSNAASFPLVVFYFTILGIITRPLENYISRRFEINADIMAVKTTALKEAFVSMMNKLASQNLADPSPGKLTKIFFFDHPPIKERIEVISKLYP